MKCYLDCLENEGQTLKVDTTEKTISILTPWRNGVKEEVVVTLSKEDLISLRNHINYMVN